MDWIEKKKVLIVGLGLMGGSYAKALKRLGFHIMALDRDEETISYALRERIIHEGSAGTEDERLIREADVIISCLYPEIFPDWVKEHQHLFKPGLMMTDVTGVKSCIVYQIQEILREDAEFIAAHPMAGRERSGVEYSDDRIFRDANYIVVPTEKNTAEGIRWCGRLGQLLGCGKITVLSPEEHDEMIAFVSQLTHCIAVSLMTCSDNTHLVDYTGDPFRDLHQRLSALQPLRVREENHSPLHGNAGLGHRHRRPVQHPVHRGQERKRVRVRKRP
ncbi:MAG: prephenate dehydrogenase [Clostridiales bacterium]|nr:prephenate dehydrogenase [Clostridiales bacterium]